MHKYSLCMLDYGANRAAYMECIHAYRVISIVRVTLFV